jgi:hypothetical protein
MHYQTPVTVALERGMRIAIFWGQDEETRAIFLEIRASQKAVTSVVKFRDESTGEDDSIPLSYIHHIEKVGD